MTLRNKIAALIRTPDDARNHEYNRGVLAALAVVDQESAPTQTWYDGHGEIHTGCPRCGTEYTNTFNSAVCFRVDCPWTR